MKHLLQKYLVGHQGPLKHSVIKEIKEVSGGCIHDAWQIDLQDGRVFFAKTGQKEVFKMLKSEAKALRALKNFADENWLNIPEPLSVEEVSDSAILLLPWLNIRHGNQSSLGTGLALLHKKSANNGPGKFGWETDGFIGSGTQPGGWRYKWGETFINLRLKPQLLIAKSWGLNMHNLEPLLNHLIEFLDPFY